MKAAVSAVEPYSVNFPRLLRLSGKAERKEQSAKRETKEFWVFVLGCCGIPHG
jgi:hypothetical protein